MCLILLSRLMSLIILSHRLPLNRMFRRYYVMGVVSKKIGERVHKHCSYCLGGAYNLCRNCYIGSQCFDSQHTPRTQRYVCSRTTPQHGPLRQAKPVTIAIPQPIVAATAASGAPSRLEKLVNNAFRDRLVALMQNSYHRLQN